GMVSFLAESEQEAADLVARTKIWKLAESLGGVESLIEVPARMTHASTVDSPFAAPPNLIRLSVGLESPDDLLDDLEVALALSTATGGEQPPGRARAARPPPPSPRARHRRLPVGDRGRSGPFRLRAFDLPSAAEGAAARARARARRRAAPAAFAHPSRP